MIDFVPFLKTFNDPLVSVNLLQRFKITVLVRACCTVVTVADENANFADSVVVHCVSKKRPTFDLL